MKKLKKMLLINWHYFSFESVEFDSINFLTGKNASGKSTLIDAMQVLLLGETSSYYFNKAANEKSSRTLQGYLRGELGDDGSTGFRCLREGDFNTYIVMEFEDENKEGFFTVGIVFDVYSDGTHRHRYFLYDGRIPDNNFLENDLPPDIEKLRKILNSSHFKRVQFPESNTSYRESLRAKLGQLNVKFFSLLKKAVPFSPITDIETFITEYICDVKNDGSNRIDVSYMRENLRSYTRLKNEVVNVKERIGILESIEEKHSELKSQKETVRLHGFLTEKGELDLSEEELEKLIAKVKNKENEISEKHKEKELLKKEEEEKEEEKNRCQRELDENDAQKKINNLDSQIKSKTDARNKITDEISRVIRNLNAYGKKWHEPLIRISEEITLENDPGPLIKDAYKMKNISFDAEDDINEINPPEISSRAIKVFSETVNIKYDKEKRLRELKEEKEAKKRILEDLKKGEKQFPDEVTKLKNILERELSETGEDKVSVTVLADAIEIKDRKWANVIEGYLNTQKFNLIVPPEHFIKALRIYDKYKEEYSIYGAGLVDIEKILSRKDIKYPENSLFREIISDDKYAMAYAGYILGNVIKCENTDDLRKHKISVTPEGMLYKNYVAARINPARWKVPFIGKNSIRIQIEDTTRRLFELNEEEKELSKLIDILMPFSAADTINENEAEDMKRHLLNFKNIQKLKKEIDMLEEEKASIDLTYIIKLEENIVKVKDNIKAIHQKIEKLAEDIGGLKTNVKTLNEFKIPECKKKIKVLSDDLEEKYSREWTEQRAMPRYLKECQNKSIKEIRDIFAVSLKSEKTKYENKKKNLDDDRADYNRRYNISHDYSDEENRDYSKALSELKQNKLVEYEEKISDSEKKTYEQFRDEFLSKLKSNFDEIKSQIDELNAAIRLSNFGNDQYRYKVEPKPEYRRYYDMITDELLLTEGINLGSYAFREKHKDAIEELFGLIIEEESAKSSDSRSEIEKNIKRFTDYRTYLNFDLIVKDQSGREQRLSKTLLKKSGGETQTPFYLSVLASFSHLYRVHKSESLSNTARLIIFDEAFSKMDSQRIEESLQLLRKFRLQAIISAPPEKIPDITPFVDNNLCVIRKDDRSFVKSFSAREGEDIK